MAQRPRNIELNKSSIDIDDEDVYMDEYERKTPVFKVWYFWVVLVVAIVLSSNAMRLVKPVIGVDSVETPQGTSSLDGISFTPPTGWTKVDETSYVGPGEGSTINIAVHKVSRFSDVDEFGKLVAELSDIDEVEEKEINGIKGRYICWKTRKVVDGEEIYTDYARYVFVYKGRLYIVMYKSADGTPEVFETFINSISKK